MLPQKKMYKVVTAVEKHGGGSFWMRLGTAIPNKDGSLNVYLDAIPKSMQFTIFEMTEEDLRKRDPSSTLSSSYGNGNGRALAAPTSTDIPF